MKRPVPFALMALVLAACGDKPAEDRKDQAKAAPVAAAVADDSVAAVLQSQGEPVAKLRFTLDSRPVVGVPFKVKLAVTAAAPVPALQFTANSYSLIVEPVAGYLSIDSAGAVATRELAVTGQHEGLAEINVRLATDAAAGSGTLYVIPVLVAKAGDAAPAQPASDEADPAPEADHAAP